METNDFLQGEHSANDPLPHVFAHQRRILVEKATNELLKAEEKEPLCDRIAQNMADVEAGNNFGVYNFLR